MDAISVFSGDSRYRELINEGFDAEGVNMCEIYDSIEKKGIKEGIKEGRLEMCEENIRKLMKNASLSVDEAMNLLGIKGKTRTTMKKAIQG